MATEVELYLSIKTPLDKGTFQVVGITGEEHISGLFHYNVEMGSQDTAVDFSALLGKEVTVSIGSEDGTSHYRHGIIVRLRQSLDMNRNIIYVAEVCPWLWLLTKTSDCRIFQNLSVPDIIKMVFSDLGHTDFSFKLAGTYSPREYCVQYSETHFDFVSRLMEDEGIFYFFTHEDGKHTLVLADDADAHTVCPGLDGALHFKQFTTSWAEEASVNSCTLEEQIVLNEYKMTDYNFEAPTTNLLVSTQGTANATGSTLSMYEYPGGYSKKNDGDKRAKVRIETFELPMKMVHGSTNCRDLITGCKFTLTDHVRSDMNIEYVLGSVHITATLQRYENSFVAFPSTVPFRPPQNTPKPSLHGYQIATVVGKSGEEIWTDEYGRVKVHFPWDTRSKQNESSSCWIRVAQMWAGKGWGTMAIPRIGTEVIISFLDGDPDRPLIVGTVYNGQQVAPYSLPDNQTRTTMKSNSSKGGGGYNEIRLEDLKGSEEIFINAEKDYNVEVGNNRTTDIVATNTLTVGGDDSEDYQAKRTISVAKQDSETYGDTRTIVVNKDDTESYSANRTIDVAKNETISIGKDRSETVSGKQTVKITKEYSITSKKMQIVADDEIVLKTGSASITMKKNGDITIKGKKIEVKGSGDVIIKGSKIAEN